MPSITWMDWRMKWLTDYKAFNRWIRILHRDLGFLMVGLCIVYGVSGILLNHLGSSNPAYKIEKGDFVITAGLDQSALTSYWKDDSSLPTLKRILPGDSGTLKIYLEGGIGVYNVESGAVIYEKSTKRPFVYWINKFHYNQVKHWTIVADIFAIVLIFFAISGLFMVKGKKGIAGRGKWYLLAGILIPIIYVLLS